MKMISALILTAISLSAPLALAKGGVSGGGGGEGGVKQILNEGPEVTTIECMNGKIVLIQNSEALLGNEAAEFYCRNPHLAVGQFTRDGSL
jgi:hypothetical protein